MVGRGLAVLLLTAGVAVGCNALIGNDDGSYAAAPTSATDAATRSDSSDAEVDSSTPCDLSRVDDDPKNCGQCGHDCLGGACSDRACQPMLVATAESETIIDVTVDSSRVLWLTSKNGGWDGPGHVHACPKAGCEGSTPPSLVDDGLETGNLASDGDRAVFASFLFGSRRILELRGDGTSKKIDAISSHLHAVRLHLQGGRLFYLSLYEGSNDAGVLSQNRVLAWDGTVEHTLATFDGSIENFSDLTVNSTRLFISSYQTVASAPVADGSLLVTFATTGAGIKKIASDETRVYLATENPKQVVACPVMGPCASPDPILTSKQLLDGAPRGLHVSGGRIYVSTDKGDLIVCVAATCASTARVLVHERNLLPLGNTYGDLVAEDDGAVYWAALDVADAGTDAAATPTTWRIMKLAK